MKLLTTVPNQSSMMGSDLSAQSPTQEPLPPLAAYLHKAIEDSQGQDSHREERRCGHDDQENGEGVVDRTQQHKDGGGQNLVDDVDVLGEAIEDAA